MCSFRLVSFAATWKSIPIEPMSQNLHCKNRSLKTYLLDRNTLQLFRLMEPV